METGTDGLRCGFHCQCKMHQNLLLFDWRETNGKSDIVVPVTYLLSLQQLGSALP